MSQEVPWLQQVIQRVSQRLTLAEYPLLEDDVLDLLESHLEVAYPILDELLRLGKDNPGNLTMEQQACLLLLCEILSFVHYAIEQNRDWASDFIIHFQEYIAANAFVPEVDSQILQNLLDILHQTEIDVIDPIRQANARLIENALQHETPVQPENIAGLLEEIAHASSGCEYQIYDNLVSQTHQIIPIEVQFIMISEMLHAKEQNLVDASILMLMHPEPLIREQTASLIRQYPEKISSRSLSRLIVMRNWLPKAERSGVDRLVKAARLSQVNCAPWPKASIAKVTATGFDGVGAQSLLVLSRQRQQYHLAGLLLKESVGIREPLLFRSKRKTESDRMIRDMGADSSAIPIQQSYLDLAIPHFLAINIRHGHPPSPLLLHFAELMGVSYWRAEALNEDSIVKKLFAEISLQSRPEDIMARTLAKSKTWVERRDFAESWFEQDAEVDNQLELILDELNYEPPLPVHDLVGEVCDKILEPRRLKWRNRLLWMALWAKNGTRKRGPNWQEFLLLAKAIQDGMRLEEIPLMKSISAETVFIAARELIY